MKQKMNKLLRVASDLQLAKSQQAPLEIKLNKKLKRLLAKGKSDKGAPMISIGCVNVIVVHDDGSSQKPKSPFIDQQKNEAIMDYVNRLKPIVNNQFLNNYNAIWTDILEERDVKQLIYNKGKQQDTTFNRNLVAQIIHQIAPLVYVPTANTVVMAELLEPGKGVSHPVRQKLGEAPEKHIKKLIDNTLKQYT